MATIKEIEEAFIAADKAGNTEDAQFFADELIKLRGVDEPKNKKDIRKIDLELTTPEKIATKVDQFRRLVEAPFKAVPIVNKFFPEDQQRIDFATGASTLMRGGANLISGESKAGEKIWPSHMANANSPSRSFGEFLDPVGWSIAGGVNKFMPFSSPFGSGAKEGLIATGKNALSGMLTGGFIGALSEKGTAGEGAVSGAISSAGMPYVLAAAAKGAGWALDALKGRLSDIRAGKIIREAAGDEIDKIRAAFLAAGDDVSAAQAAEIAKSTKFSALGKLAEQKDSQYYNNLYTRQIEDQADVLRRIAGAANQTEAKKVASESKSALGNVYRSVLNPEIDAANTAGRLFPKYKNESEVLSNIAADKVQRVRDMAAAENRALDIANNTYPVQGMPRISGKYTYMGEKGGIANRAAQEAEKAAEQSLIAGEGSRFAIKKAESLAAHGLRPIDVNPVLLKLKRQAANPEIAGNKQASDIIGSVYSDIQEWAAKNGGIIDAEALDAIRRNSVNAAVERLLGPADPKAKAAAAAAAMKEIKPVIVKAIVDAGGTEYPAALKTYEEGIKLIQQKKLGAKALEMFQKNPDSFVELVSMNNPKLVEKIFKTDFDINSAMGKKFIEMQKVADQRARDKSIEELARKGSDNLADVLKKYQSTLRIPNFLSPKITATNAALDVIEGNINKKVMAKVYNAMRNGKDATDLMNQLSTFEKSLVLKAVQRGNLAPYLSAGTTNIYEGNE